MKIFKEKIFFAGLSLLKFNPHFLLILVIIAVNVNNLNAQTKKQLKHNQPQLSVEMAEAMVSSGKLDSAIICYSDLVGSNPEHLAYWKRLATLYGWTEQPLEAIRCLENIVKLDPADIKSLNQLAQFYVWTDQQSKAIDIYRQSVERDTGDIGTRKKLAQLYSWNNRPDDALRQYKYIASVDSSDINVLATLAQNYIWNGKPMQAIQQLERLNRLVPDSIKYSKMLAQQYQWNDRQVDAIRIYENIIRENPNDLEAKNNLARLYMWNNRSTEATPLFFNIVQNNPRDRTARLNLAESQFYAQQWKAAKRNLKLLREDQNNDTKVEYLLQEIAQNYNPRLNAKASRFSDSNGLTINQYPIRSFIYANERLSYDIEFEKAELNDNRVKRHASGTGAKVSMRYHLTRNIRTGISAGLSSWTTNWQSGNFSLGLDAFFESFGTLSVSYQHHESREGFSTIAERIRINGLRINLNTALFNDFQIYSVAHLEDYSDHNSKTTVSLSGYYTARKSRPSVVTFVSYLYEDFKNIYALSIPYWTPNKLGTFTSGLEIGFPLISKLRVDAAYAGTWQKQEYANNYRLGISFDINKANALGLRYEYLGAKIYHSEYAQAEFSHRF